MPLSVRHDLQADGGNFMPHQSMGQLPRHFRLRLTLRESASRRLDRVGDVTAEPSKFWPIKFRVKGNREKIGNNVRFCQLFLNGSESG